MGFLRRLIGRGARRAAPVQRTLFIDDDVAGEVEILPAASANWARREMAAIADAPPPGDAGWQDVRLRRPDADAPSVGYLAIQLAEAASSLNDRLAPFDAVVTGDPNRPTPTVGRGYGPSPLSAVVIYAPAGTENISAIEVTLRGTPADNAAVLSAIGALPAALIAADWSRGRIANLRDAAEIARFLG